MGVKIMIVEITRISDLYPTPFTQNVFTDMKADTELNEILSVILKNDDEWLSVGIDYIYNKSYSKRLSPMLVALLSGYVIDNDYKYVYDNDTKITWGEFVERFNRKTLNDVIRVRYRVKWKQLIKALEQIQQEYEILSPFHTQLDDNITQDFLGSDTTNSTDNHSTTEDNSVFPFNVNFEKDENGNDVQQKSVPTSTNSESLNYTDKSKYERNGAHTRKATRKGNIGNMTNQQLIEEEINLRKNQIIDIIFDDLDSILTRNFY
jgi:hypothetical protein